MDAAELDLPISAQAPETRNTTTPTREMDEDKASLRHEAAGAAQTGAPVAPAWTPRSDSPAPSNEFGEPADPSAPDSAEFTPPGTPRAAKPHWRAVMKEREKTAPRCRVVVHADDARDKVLMGIVRVLIKTGNIPSTPKELTAMILHWKIVRMGGATPHATISSRISQHFKRCAEANPVREPILGAWAAEGVRRLRYFVNYKGVPVAEVPKERLEHRFQLELPTDGRSTPDKAATPTKRSLRVAESKSRAETPGSASTLVQQHKSSPLATAPGSTPYLGLEGVKVEAEGSDYQSSMATPDGLRPHPQIGAQTSLSPALGAGPGNDSGDEVESSDIKPLKRKAEEDEPAVAAFPAVSSTDEQRVPDSILLSPQHAATAGGPSRGQTPKARKHKKPKVLKAEPSDEVFDSDSLSTLGTKLQSPQQEGPQ